MLNQTFTPGFRHNKLTLFIMLDAPAFQLFDENNGFLTQLLLQIHIPYLYAIIMKVSFSGSLPDTWSLPASPVRRFLLSLFLSEAQSQW